MKIINTKTTAKMKYKTIKIVEDGKPLNVHIKKNVSFFEWMTMVGGIVDFVFDDELEIIDGYKPEQLAFAQRFIIIKGFTDYNFPEFDGNDSTLENIWNVIKYTKLYDEVVKYASHDINEILAEANNKIQAKVSYLANKTDTNALIDKFSKGLDSFSTQFNNVDAQEVLGLVKKLNGVSADSIIDSMVKSVKGIKGEKILKK